eukprot:TRINITY_DN33343_c0_g1_i1.p1 TRINITY_DN33343_c0_g1~~TRINITY_DN33343_c0_g1_i1.p1  ORF type:complete len:126 (-),score=8.57 TRINITY_DN33343_c0_g1_i1:67-414(-)
MSAQSHTPPDNELKLSILASDSQYGESCRTFVFRKENHTLGNCLRTMLLLNPQVRLAGYTMPHPSEEVMHLRIQTEEGYPAQSALRQAFVDLKAHSLQLKKKFESAVQEFQSSPS